MRSDKVFGVLLVGVLMMMEVCVSLPTKSASSEEVDDKSETTTITSTILISNQSSGSSDSENYSDAVIVESLSDETGESEQENESEEVKDFNPSDCLLEKTRGPCRAVIESWYFNGESCEMFMWSGCGGNNNRFREKSHCEKRCMIKQEEAETQETVIETTLSPIVSRIMETTMEALSSSSTTSTSTSTTTTTTVSPPATSTTSLIKSTKPKFRCPKFEGCPNQCIVVQSVQSNHGCKTCQCAEAESDVNSSSSSSSSTSVKTTRSTSKSEISAVKSSIGSVSGLPASSDDESTKEDSHTEKPEDVCNLAQPPRGNCRAMLTRYRYDNKKGTCVEFHFGGNCDGSANANNFVTKEKCLEFCKGQ